MKVAVCGCGRMGGPMAAALHRSGVDVVGFDVAEKPWPFMATLSALDDRETIFTVVRDQDETDALLFDVQRVASLPAMRTLVICSTLSPKYVRQLRERVPSHITLIDAPMSGAAIAAEEARLSFMLGGEVKAIAAIQPLLDIMGSHFHHMGPFGAGMAAKVLNNLVAASSTAATRTALAWADAHGMDREKLLALMHNSSGQTWFGSGFESIEFARDGFADENTIGILAKDVAAAIDGAPTDADTTLAQELIRTIRNLKPLD
ncbi:NAD(P)-dependent oxidoreductase [Pontivivens insulae]|uniref:3-hydroxyisobutyrate dehydrogenase n=1 Tax=Pontivivens insulae TaxID=1639689 RepID=A0A2R8A972_9RHOB|nr:NAD(P)-binding domain-containing protein [Pontivivens insulae]RED18702.1 3-hydroxyisobutyrate dehydrogenase [Pontivivens insulae]SPF28600.1 3-hydroxyisobutyrate dehydrogenase [Pontivivens insulae]